MSFIYLSPKIIVLTYQQQLWIWKANFKAWKVKVSKNISISCCKKLPIFIRKQIYILIRIDTILNFMTVSQTPCETTQFTMQHITIQIFFRQKDGQQLDEIPVYNCGITKTIRATNRDIEDEAMPIWKKYPSPHIVWVKSLVYAPNKSCFRILFLLRMVLPALFADIVLYSIGKQPM